MSSKHNLFLHNFNSTIKRQNFVGWQRQKYHNLEFIVSITIKFWKNIANR